MDGASVQLQARERARWPPRLHMHIGTVMNADARSRTRTYRTAAWHDHAACSRRVRARLGRAQLWLWVCARNCVSCQFP
eukprot:4555451-Pleurochrysis_carterae.AAC.1